MENIYYYYYIYKFVSEIAQQFERKKITILKNIVSEFPSVKSLRIIISLIAQ